MRYAPAALSACRLLAVPWIAWQAAHGARDRWRLAVVASVVVDLADGMLARRIGDPVALRRQRCLDGLADTVFSAAVPLGAWQLRPDLPRAERTPIVLFATAQMTSLVACGVRFGCLPRYRTAAYKWSSGALALALAWCVADGAGTMMFPPAIALLTLAHLEAVVITLRLPAYRQPVRSARTLFKGARACAE